MNAGVMFVLIIIVVVIVGFIILTYNGLVQRRLRVDEAMSQIQVQLKRRWDLIPNLVNAVQGYMDFEQGVLTNVTNARAAAVAAGGQGPAAPATAENALTGTLRSLFAVVENYPDAQGQRERAQPAGAADHDRESDQLLAPALQRHRARLQHVLRDRSQQSCSRDPWASPSANSSRQSRGPAVPQVQLR